MNNSTNVVEECNSLTYTLNNFRQQLYEQVFMRRRHGLFETVDAIISSEQPIHCIAHLSLNSELSHSGLYDALAHGQLNTDRLTGAWFDAAASLNLPAVYSVDATCWPRPDAHTVPGRAMVHVTNRTTNGSPSIPGFDFQTIVRQDPGKDSWSGPVDVRILDPTNDMFAQVLPAIRQTVQRHEGSGDSRRPLFVFDTGYPPSRLVYQTRTQDLACDVLVRLAGNRVFYKDLEPEHVSRSNRGGKHGTKFCCNNPSTHPEPDRVEVVEHYPKFGTITLAAWGGYHQKLAASRSGMGTRSAIGPKKYQTDMPVVSGTLIQATFTDSGKRDRMWLFYSGEVDTADLAGLFTAYAHRFDIEHMFKFLKRSLGMVCPMLGSVASHLLWVQLVLTAFVELVLARGGAADARLPWEAVKTRARLTPGRVKRWLMARLHTYFCPVHVTKPGAAGTGRVKGSRNRPRERFEVLMRPGRRHYNNTS